MLDLISLWKARNKEPYPTSSLLGTGEQIGLHPSVLALPFPMRVFRDSCSELGVSVYMESGSPGWCSEVAGLSSEP